MARTVTILRTGRVGEVTVSGTVAPGRYAIAAGEELFEVEIR